MTQDNCWIQVKWLAHGSHITDGDQDVDSVDLETLSSTTDSVQERTFEGGSRQSISMASTFPIHDDAWKAPMDHAMQATITLHQATPFSFGDHGKRSSQATGFVVEDL